MGSHFSFQHIHIYIIFFCFHIFFGHYNNFFLSSQCHIRIRTTLSSENQTMLWTLLDILRISSRSGLLVSFFFVLCTNHLDRPSFSGRDIRTLIHQVDSDCSRYFGRTEVRAFRNIACFMHTNIKTFRIIVVLERENLYMCVFFCLYFNVTNSSHSPPIFIIIIRFIINKYCLRSS